MKYRMEKNGKTIAESDWSNVLFSYRKEHVRAENQAQYVIWNNETGKLAGTK